MGRRRLKLLENFVFHSLRRKIGRGFVRSLPSFRGSGKQELGHGQPLAGDPGAAEVTATASRAAGPRPRVGSRMRVRGRPLTSSPLFCLLTGRGAVLSSPATLIPAPAYLLVLNSRGTPNLFLFYLAVIVVVLNRTPRFVFSSRYRMAAEWGSMMRIQWSLCISYRSSRKEK